MFFKDLIQSSMIVLVWKASTWYLQHLSSEEDLLSYAELIFQDNAPLFIDHTNWIIPLLAIGILKNAMRKLEYASKNKE